MRLFLMAGGLAAAALFAACEKSNENNSENSGRINPQDLNQSPYQMDARHQQTVTIRNPSRLFLDLCEAEFGLRDLTQCKSINRQAIMRDTPSIHAQGLNAYFNTSNHIILNYEHLDNPDRPWYNLLHQRDGIEQFLVGTVCPNNNPFSVATCVRINDERNLSVPTRFDFIDDQTNLIGLFLFLQHFQVNETLDSPTAHCEIKMVTLGNAQNHFCSMFSMHNLVLTPEAVARRFLGQENIPNVRAVKQELSRQSNCYR